MQSQSERMSLSLALTDEDPFRKRKFQTVIKPKQFAYAQHEILRRCTRH